MFPKQGVLLLAELKENNTREWYQSAKKEIDTHVIKAGSELADSCRVFLESELKIGLQTKIYRLNRDLRFSKDKTPYNSHFRFSIWPQGQEQSDAVCFHVSVEPDQFIVGTGLWELGPRIETFRRRAGEIESLLGSNIRLSEPELKKVPRDYPADHSLADHYRRKGFSVWIDRVQSPQDIIVPEAELMQLIPIFKWMNHLTVD